MPLYLPDTSAWNRSGATQEASERWRSLIARGEVAVCAPVRLELLYSARGRRDYEALATYLGDLPDLPLDAPAGAVAERTQAALAEGAQHRGPRPIDLLIAAIAEAQGAVLLHYDRHFEAIGRVTGQPMEWLAPRGSLA